MKERRYRFENKYICSEYMLTEIEQRIKPFCNLDENVINGQYTISSIYFDDDYHSNWFDNENGIDPRGKYRIRVYNDSLDSIHLEKKMKIRGMTAKQLSVISSEMFLDIVLNNNNWLMNQELNDDIGREFKHDYYVNHIRPKVVVRYDRIPYIYPIGNVRITFDRNIESGLFRSKLNPFDTEYIPAFPTGFHILEVKYDNLLPDYIRSALDITHLNQTNYSKYYYCRKILFNIGEV